MHISDVHYIAWRETIKLKYFNNLNHKKLLVKIFSDEIIGSIFDFSIMNHMLYSRTCVIDYLTIIIDSIDLIYYLVGYTGCLYKIAQ